MQEFGQEEGSTSRREVIALGVLILSGVVIDKVVTGGKSNQNEPPANTPNQDPTIVGPTTFEDAGANSVAEQLGITPGGYYDISHKTVTEMTGGKFLSDRLAPIFPPSVQRYAKLMRQAAEQHGLPVNFLATIMTIESTGQASVTSEADAYGLMQVVPEDHFDDFAQHLPKGASVADYQKARNGEASAVPLDTYQRTFSNPVLNLNSGAKFLASCLQTARDTTGLDPNSPGTFAWAGAYYNGGQGLAGQAVDQLPTQTQLYTNHVIRILMDTEIAGRLGDQGYDDHQVLKAMFSNEMNARAYAYGTYGDHFPMNDINDYNVRAGYLAVEEPGHNANGSLMVPEGALVSGWYEDYLRGTADISTPDHKYDIPAAPGLRIWMEGGGMSAIANIPEDAAWRL